MDYPTNTAIGQTAVYNAAVSTILARPGAQINEYNPYRPYAGAFPIEDDGVALRELSWAEYKKGIHRTYYWESTYWNDYQVSGQENNLFHSAKTYGLNGCGPDPVKGQLCWGDTNGEGVLFYPGTDVLFPADSYKVQGVFASLRLKHWRRGIQDVDYLTLAAAKNPPQSRPLSSKWCPKPSGTSATWAAGSFPPSPGPSVQMPGKAPAFTLAAIIEGQ